MLLEDIKRGLRSEIKKRETEQYATFQTNIRRMCQDALETIEEQEEEIRRLRKQLCHNSVDDAVKPQVLQFRHNNSDGFVAGYDRDDMDKYLDSVFKKMDDLQNDFVETRGLLQTANLVASEQKRRAEELLSCLKYLVYRDLIKECVPKRVAVDIVNKYDITTFNQKIQGGKS